MFRRFWSRSRNFRSNCTRERTWHRAGCASITTIKLFISGELLHNFFFARSRNHVEFSVGHKKKIASGDEGEDAHRKWNVAIRHAPLAISLPSVPALLCEQKKRLFRCFEMKLSIVDLKKSSCDTWDFFPFFIFSPFFWEPFFCVYLNPKRRRRLMNANNLGRSQHVVRMEKFKVLFCLLISLLRFFMLLFARCGDESRFNLKLLYGVTGEILWKKYREWRMECCEKFEFHQFGRIWRKKLI